MLVWLASFPRSGNRFIQSCLSQLYGAQTASVYDESRTGQLAAGEPLVARGPAGIESLDAKLEPIFVKTHELPGGDSYPAIYLMRDGRDSLVSYARFVLSHEPAVAGADPDELFRQRLFTLMTSNLAFGGWAAHVRAWRHRPRTVVIRFEDLVTEPEKSIAGALAGLGVSIPRLPGSRPPTFKELKESKPSHFRRGKIGGWRDEMPADLHNLFCLLYGDALKANGYADGLDLAQPVDPAVIRRVVRTLQNAQVAERERREQSARATGQDALLRVIVQHRKDLTLLRERFLKLRRQFNTQQAPAEQTKRKIATRSKPLWPVAKATYLVQRIKGVFAPRIGVLRQHGPKPLRPPPHYNGAAPAAWPKISVVTPSFNQKLFLLQAMRSVLDSGYPNLEYVVVDGGSADGSKEVIETEGKRLAYWTSRPDNGQADAIQHGFEHASGEIMGWLNSDDLLLPGALQRIGAYFAAHPDVDVVYGHRILIDDDGKEIGRWVMPPHDPEILRWADYLPQETLYWRRSIWEKTGARMDVNLNFAMDWELLHRFTEARARFARLPQFLAAFRIHDRQKTVQNRQREHPAARECDALRDRIQGRSVPRKEIGKHARRFQMRGRTYHWLYKLGIMI